MSTDKQWSHVPGTLWDAMLKLDAELPEEDKGEFRDYLTTEENPRCYLIANMGLRNGWGLWQDSPLAHWFRKRGIWHADDMSGIISTAYYHHINGTQEINEDWVAEERAYYDEHWCRSGVSAPTYESWLEENGYEVPMKQEYHP
jgi:hypothetical protein